MRKADTRENITPDFHRKCRRSAHIDDLLSKLNNKLPAALSNLPEDVYNDSDEKNMITSTLTPTRISVCINVR